MNWYHREFREVRSSEIALIDSVGDAEMSGDEYYEEFETDSDSKEDEFWRELDKDHGPYIFKAPLPGETIPVM